MLEIWNSMPEGLRLILIVMMVVSGGVFTYRKGANNMAALGVEATKLEREGNEQDRLSNLEQKIGNLVMEVHGLRAEMIGLQVSFANILLCDPCRKTNEVLLNHINARLAQYRREQEIEAEEKAHV